MSGPRWVLVVIDGDGPLENPRVFGPWRSREKAEAARARLDKIVHEEDGHAFGVTMLEPEYGERRSFAAYLRRLREQRDPG